MGVHRPLINQMRVRLAENNGAALDIALVLTVFNPLDSIIAYEFCSRLISCFQNQGLRCAGIIVDNRKKKQVAGRKLEKWWTISGSNSFAEFSGYQEGLEWLISFKSFTRRSIVIFANDTIASHRSFICGSIEVIAQQILSQQEGISGFVESRGWKGFSIGNMAFDKWISTFFFSATFDDLIKLNFKIKDSIVNSLVMRQDSGLIFSPVVSTELQQHIIKWLTTPGQWHGAKPLQDWDKELLHLKTACILSEKLLSAKCITKQIAINELPCNLFFYERN